ncbi:MULTISPECIES: PrsW family intramembrane metalloprotease [Halolamina]|uniref:Membrane proteinase PrsW, cleaves anti-sigma factor RsiW, M82 family n=1 Tax=Halolamina pelagica TaxID=699431 RepID=A0A1I5NGT9_9EURY|nr:MULTISPECIES: PrsW family intramembrane metalloprotease [Halolamina]NHX36305.1 PrsW family intramembrane metalloprotease [Halolamina sp. R1-12]SFP20984.1 Membrane proteinase PrsW, cleaves anti-sigma factor RsiW, M82 family [Halolamina pelagica]
MSDSDPVEEAASDGRDLYDIATWEPRTVLDRTAVRLHGALSGVARLSVVLLAAFVFLIQVGGVVWLASRNPTVGAVALLSALPALVLVAFVWRQDVVEKEPIDTLAVTFVLSVLFASFAATANTLLQGTFRMIPLVGMGLFFFLVVAPVEEAVKWLAVRLHAYRRPEFDAVIDGAVYGAVAGLGFATIENTLYVVQGFLRAQEAGATQAIGAAIGTATSRALAGPGHVIYSAWAGYYLGLAKFNRENRGPIVVKGLLIAALLHGGYNTTVTYVPALFSPPNWWYLLFVVAFDGTFFYLLYRKLGRYRDNYAAVNGEARSDEADAGESDDADGREPDDTEESESDETGERASERAGSGDDTDSTGDAVQSDDPGPVWDAPDRTDPVDDDEGDRDGSGR